MGVGDRWMCVGGGVDVCVCETELQVAWKVWVHDDWSIKCFGIDIVTWIVIMKKMGRVYIRPAPPPSSPLDALHRYTVQTRITFCKILFWYVYLFCGKFLFHFISMSLLSKIFFVPPYWSIYVNYFHRVEACHSDRWVRVSRPRQNAGPKTTPVTREENYGGQHRPPLQTVWGHRVGEEVVPKTEGQVGQSLTKFPHDSKTLNYKRHSCLPLSEMHIYRAPIIF